MTCAYAFVKRCGYLVCCGPSSSTRAVSMSPSWLLQDAWSSASSQPLPNLENPFIPAKGGLLDKYQVELLQARRLNQSLPLPSLGQELGHPKPSLTLGRPNSAETIANALHQAPGYVGHDAGLGNLIQDRRKSWPPGESCWGMGASPLIDSQPLVQLPSSPSASMSLGRLSLGAPLREGAPSEGQVSAHQLHALIGF
jgi:hypothetical protein